VSRQSTTLAEGGVNIQISIDGPAAAGKSTLARALAKKLGYIHIDSGAMYRALTWLALREGVDIDNADALTELAREADILFEPDPENADYTQRVFCRGLDITKEIRGLDVSQNVSAISSIPGVREVLVEAQRKMASDRDVVMEGRDIGTVVLPRADYKLFLTASVEERARRRWKERGGGDQDQTLAEIIAEIAKRDAEDANRANSPLRPAPDSVILDSTDLSFSEVIEEAARLVGFNASGSE